MKFLQKLGKAIMLPVACLPLCGILMGIGYMLCPASMQGGEITGFLPTAGLFLVKAGGAILDHMALLFAVGVGIGMTDDRDGTAGLCALISWLMVTVLLSKGVVSQILPSLSEKDALAFESIENPFIGILCGLIGAGCYGRFRRTSLPEWLAFFSGKRSTVIVSGLASVLAAGLLLVIWPLLFGALISFGEWIRDLGPFGAAIYAFLNRLLIPVGLHHPLNNVFWFDTIGLGDIKYFWAGKVSADVSWDLGIYMSGFFPCMMFGIPGAALAMIQCAKKENRRRMIGLLGSAALCAFVCGVTEPFEFAFMFAAPILYLAYALLYGVFAWIVSVTGFRAGFAFSAGATDLFFSSSLPAAQKTWLIIPLGLAAFAAFYLVFFALIKALHLNTPGREEMEAPGAGRPSVSAAAVPAQPSAAKTAAQSVAGVDVEALLSALGGRENIVSLDHCMTRLRLEVRDSGGISAEALKKSGAKGAVITGKSSLQVIIGMKVEQVAEALKPLL